MAACRFEYARARRHFAAAVDRGANQRQRRRATADAAAAFQFAIVVVVVVARI